MIATTGGPVCAERADGPGVAFGSTSTSGWSCCTSETSSAKNEVPAPFTRMATRAWGKPVVENSPHDVACGVLLADGDGVSRSATTTSAAVASAWSLRLSLAGTKRNERADASVGIEVDRITNVRHKHKLGSAEGGGGL